MITVLKMHISVVQVVLHMKSGCFEFKICQASYLCLFMCKIKVWCELRGPKRGQIQKTVNIKVFRVIRVLKMHISIVQVVLHIKQWLFLVQDSSGFVFMILSVQK